MTNSPLAKATLAKAALEYVPPLIRRTLLNDRRFNEEFGFKAEALIVLGEGEVAIQRTVLFEGVRSILAGVENTEIVDERGRAWQLSNEAEEGEQPSIILKSGDEGMMLPDFAVLASDVALRIESLEHSSADVNLPNDAKERWREILTERPLEDEEVDTFHCEIRNTPVYLERTIRSEVDSGESSISSLVPNSLEYYRRLVGAYDGSVSIQAYAAGAGQQFLKYLSKWRPYEGFLYGLLLSSHSTLTDEIRLNNLDSDEIIQAFEFIESHGDMLSRLGAFEVGLRTLPIRPEIEPVLLRLVNRIRDDDLDGDKSDFKLFSSLFVLVDGELSRTRLMSDYPPFYRRLASLAQAALIHRILVESEIDYKRVCEWAIAIRFEHYYMQSLSDMRTEPRWNPDLVESSQIKEEFFGRLMNAGHKFSENIGEGELRETILGDGKESLAGSSSFLRPYYPGPLEGSEESPNPLPEDLASVIDEDLNNEDIDASSFIALVNSAMIFRVRSDQAELTAKALRLGNYTLSNIEDKSQLAGILNGLAMVAAVSRSPELADEVRILVRRYLHDPQYKFSVEEAMRMCLVASAARRDLSEWRQGAGQWLTELAFGELDDSDAEALRTHLSALLNAVPELWATCARADAVLEALCFH